VKPHLRSVASVAATGLCLLIAACGGGDSESGGSSGNGGALSEAEFVKQADKICKEGREKIDDLGSPRDASDLDQYADRFAKVTSDMSARLRKLTPPAEVASDFDDYLELMATAERGVQQMAAAAQVKDVSKAQEVQKDLEAAASDSKAVANRIGFTGACAN
jgi:hypothetical protein